MLDFALHGWDLVDALGLRQPHLVGHSMGGMIAAEMACLAPRDLAKLVLVGAAGLWLEEHPIPDIFAMLPQEIAEVLFVDPARGATLFTGGADLSDIEALKDFYVVTQRRLAMAGKILFPIPNRRLSRRLYRLTAETLVLWGASDRLIAPAYPAQWKALIPRARLPTIDGAGAVAVRAITPGKLGPGLGLVLLAVKSQDTPGALGVLAPRLANDGAIVSMQNGLNEELIAAAVGERRTVGCLVNWSADWMAPGRILHGGEGTLVLGELDGRPSARVDALATLLEVVAPTRVSDNILGYTWAKHVYGALLVATAVVNAHVYEVVERSPETQRMLIALVMESMRVAEAAGIRLEPFG